MKKLNTNHQVSQRLLESSSRGGAWMRMFFMLVIMMMSSAFAMAQGKYGFKVAGVDVTNDNYLDLSVINGVSGKVYFDPNTRTLTLDNATIEADDINAIRNETCDYLTIELIGTNTINVTGVASGMTLEEETTIWSNCGGKLSVKSDRCAVLFRGCPLEISNCWLEAEGAWGISANDNVAEEVLKIRNSHVEATGSKGSICDIANLVLEGCSITQPTGAAFDTNKRAVALNDKKVTDKVVIEPDSYDVQIAGVDVTSLNCKDLSVIDGVDGKISYDPETKTLTMEDVTINITGEKVGISNRGIKGLKINLVGNNTINACISILEPSTISGSGTLRLKSSGDCGIYMNKSSLTVEGVKLYAEGKWGIAGYDGKSGEILTLRNAYVEATGSKGSVCDLQNLVLDGCSITQPTGAAFNVHAVVLNGDVVTDKVVIEPDSYGVRIADVDVTALNCKDLSVIDGVDGKISYDPETKTLTMEDVTINGDVTVGIENRGVKGMKIKLVGNNTITPNMTCILIYYPSTISGSGNLRLKSTRSPGIKMNSSLTVENIKLYAEGPWGIIGNNGKSGEILTLRNAYVETTGKDYGSFIYLQNLVLDGCAITQPVGAAFDANVHAVVLNGDVVTDKVVIGSDASGISDITTDVPAHAKGIYSVTGVKQTRQWNELPAGIYIVDGVKRVKR